MSARRAAPRSAHGLIRFEDVREAFFMGASGTPPPLKATLDRLRPIEEGEGVRMHLVDARVACGAAHLASALLHARRAHERGRPRARDIKVEFMLYLTGQRQIARAIALAGLSSKTHAVGVAIEGTPPAAKRAATALLHELGLSRDDSALEPTPEKGRAVGVKGRAQSPEGWEALAIEVVAALDLEG